MVPKGIGKGGGNTRREAAVDESRKEIPWQQTGKQGTRPTSGHLPRLPAPQTAAAALNVAFLRLGFVGALSVRSCSYEK